MKSYPSITKEVTHDTIIYAFAKLDGSQIRAEWNPKKGFYKFGTRTQLIDANSKPFGIAVPLIKEKYEKDLDLIFKKHKYESAICFFELWGPSSFAGSHNFSEQLTVTLFDVNPYKKGILNVEEFISIFGHLDIPKILYTGEVTAELFDMVKQSTLKDMAFEGVVCKGSSGNKHEPIMFKIKSKAWLEKLKYLCKDDEKLFKMLE